MDAFVVIVLGALILSTTFSICAGKGHGDHAAVLPEYTCHDKPCLNGGHCQQNDPIRHDIPEHDAPPPYNTPHVDHFICKCDHRWTGTYCQIAGGDHQNAGGGQQTTLPEYHCSDTPCLNGGTCRLHDPIRHDHPEHDSPKPYDKQHIDHFTCQCTSHWTGKHCETAIPEYHCADSPCLNGGTCHAHDPVSHDHPEHGPHPYDKPHVDHFTCQCTSHWTGTHCEHALHEFHCSDTPCLNGGTCQPHQPIRHEPEHGFPRPYDKPHVDNFICQCTSHWTGTHCETGLQIVQPEPNLGNHTDAHVGRCALNPCMIDGTCALHGNHSDSKYTCRCIDNRNALECNTVTGTCLNYHCYHEGLCGSDGNRVFCHRCRHAFYGDDCGTAQYCDQLRCMHGDCVHHGHDARCQCSPGWTWFDCTKDVDECAHSNPCLHGGNCTNTPGHYTCKCDAGWTGGHCQTDVDECSLSNPCQNGGNCTNTQGHYTCNCDAGWTGDHCQTDVDECAHGDPCKNGGYCTNSPGHYTCRCEKGWTGDHCQTDVNECAHINPCFHGGNCTNSPGSYTCKCDAGWTGEQCQTDVDECSLRNLCLHGGNCTNTQGHYTCSCDPGWTGDHCETDVDECAHRNPCLSGGNCTNIPGHYTCKCDAGWTGDHCQTDVDECAYSNLCLNGGNCTNNPGYYTCRCDAGWTGDHCQTDIDECNGTILCQNNGTCVNTPGNFNCSCAKGWTDTYCQTDMFPKCNHTCSLDAVILSAPVVKTTTNCLGTNTHASNEALPEVCCNMRAYADWQNGEQVQDNYGACIDGKIPPYTPIAAVNGTGFINAGIFYGCIRNGLPGFMMIRQDCTTSPQLMTVDSASDPKPDNYNVIY